MKSDYLKKIIAATVISTTMASVLPLNAAAIDFYTWQQANSQSSGYWTQSGGNWYFYDYSGILQTGWIYDKGQWYYADINGVMQTGVIQVDGKIYLFSNSGVMQTGNAVVNGQYYNFGQNGVATGSNVPTPTKAYGLAGESAVPYTPNQLVRNDDSSPSSPNTVARDPQNLIKYNVRFRDDDGDDLRTSSIEKDERINLYTPTRSGYKFVEWNTKKDGEGKSYDAGDSLTVNSNITLYAQWEKVSDNNNNNNGNNSSEKVSVESITVTSSSSSITQKGGTLQMTASVLPIDATNKNITWSIKSGTASIDSASGLLTATANGDVVVAATAADGSNVFGTATISISGQVDSNNNGGSTDNGGSTTPVNLGKITAMDKNPTLDNVVLSADEGIVDLAQLKKSGKLPTKASISCSLSDGTMKKIEIGIKDWTGTFDGTKKDPAGYYTLKAVLGDLPTGYTIDSSVTIPSPTVKIMVDTLQTDNRIHISQPVNLGEFTLSSNKNIKNMDLLNSSGILPSKVTFTVGDKTVEGTIKSWNCVGTPNFDANATNNLTANVEVPAGYIVDSTATVTATLKVNVSQTATLSEIVGVVKNSERAAKVNDGKTFKVQYLQNDELDLTNLLVEVKYNDGNTGYISYQDFASNKIQTSYFNGVQLKDATNSLVIPVTFNGKTVYSEAITVSATEAPKVTSKATIDNYIASDSTHADMVFDCTLGTGTKTATQINSVSIAGYNLTKDTDYTVSSDNKTLTVKGSGLQNYYNTVIKGGATDMAVTPTTSLLSVEFITSSNTVIKPDVSPLIHFINVPVIPTTTPAAISLATGIDVPYKDHTIKLSGVTPNLTYEYALNNTTSTWTSFIPTSTDKSINLYDLRFKKDMDPTTLYVRIKAKDDLNGGINPASNILDMPITANEVGRAKNSVKSITAFNLNYNGTDCPGTIDDITSEIKVVIPVVTDTNTGKLVQMPLTSVDVKMITDPTCKVEFQVAGGTASALPAPNATSGEIQKTGNDFTKAVTYTVTAEDGTTKTYKLTLIKTALQQMDIRKDGYSYQVLDSQGNTQTIATTFKHEYQDNIKLLFNLEDGNGSVTIPVFDYTSSTTPAAVQIASMDRLNQYTPNMSSLNSQTAYAGALFIKPYSGAKSVNVAESLENLRSGTDVKNVYLTVDSVNSTGGDYLEQIPIGKYGTVVAQQWTRTLDYGSKVKYLQWIGDNGVVLGYTAVNIKVV
jgi:uncharacterized repeat protein (TIGR02543 family)